MQQRLWLNLEGRLPMNSRIIEDAHNSDSQAGRSFGRRLYQLMAAEHANLDRLLAQVSTQKGAASIESYGEFRKGLLRHISIEEKILLPMAERRCGGEPLALAARLRLDHGALAALMMLPPSATTLSAVRAVLDAHNPLEEAPGGVYEQCERLAGPELDEILARCEAAAKVPVSPWVESSKVLAAAKRMLIRAGYEDSLLNLRDEGTE
jgi:hypothetical protein